MKRGIGTFRPDPPAPLLAGDEAPSLLSAERYEATAAPETEETTVPVPTPCILSLNVQRGREGEGTAHLPTGQVNGLRSQVREGEEESWKLDLCF